MKEKQELDATLEKELLNLIQHYLTPSMITEEFLIIIMILLLL